MHADAPKDFDPLHRAMYKWFCDRMDKDGIPTYRIDYEQVFDGVRSLHKAILNAVYVDVERDPIQHGEEN